MIELKSIITLLLTIFCFNLSSQSGPFSPAAGSVGSNAIHKDSSIFSAWGNFVTIERGAQDINELSFGNADFGLNEDAIGFSNGLVVSLGDGGIATYYLSTPIANGDGFDFAIFENAFNNDFLELAFVEVSSDDLNYYRFESISLVQDSVQVDGFGSTDPTLINNLAGKYRVEYGTPFDLAELDDLPGLNINNITSVKIIDVIGNINPPNVSYDSNNQAINEPYPTQFSSSGFDLDALGIINQITGINEYKTQTLTTAPNPFKNSTRINLKTSEEYSVFVRDLKGNVVHKEFGFGNSISIDLSDHPAGFYIAEVATPKGIAQSKLLKLN